LPTANGDVPTSVGEVAVTFMNHRTRVVGTGRPPAIGTTMTDTDPRAATAGVVEHALRGDRVKPTNVAPARPMREGSRASAVELERRGLGQPREVRFGASRRAVPSRR